MEALYPIGDVTEVCVFFAPRSQMWVVRRFGGYFALGDTLHETEPSDEELQRVFGEAVEIIRGYQVTSNKTLSLLKNPPDSQ